MKATNGKLKHGLRYIIANTDCENNAHVSLNVYAGSRDEGNSNKLAILGEKIRNLKEHGLPEGASTRLLIYAAKMISQGIKPVRACQVAVNWAVTDDSILHQGIQEVITSIFPE